MGKVKQANLLAKGRRFWVEGDDLDAESRIFKALDKWANKEEITILAVVIHREMKDDKVASTEVQIFYQ